MKVFGLVFRYFSECRKVTKKLEVDSREAMRKVIPVKVKSHDTDVALGTEEVASPTYLTSQTGMLGFWYLGQSPFEKDRGRKDF